MELASIMLSEVSQTEKIKDHIISLICVMQNREQQMNKQNKVKKELTDTNNNSMAVTRGDTRLGKSRVSNTQ